VQDTIDLEESQFPLTFESEIQLASCICSYEILKIRKLRKAIAEEMKKNNADDSLIKKLYLTLNLLVYYMHRGIEQEKDRTRWSKVKNAYLELRLIYEGELLSERYATRR